MIKKSLGVLGAAALLCSSCGDKPSENPIRTTPKTIPVSSLVFSSLESLATVVLTSPNDPDCTNGNEKNFPRFDAVADGRKIAFCYNLDREHPNVPEMESRGFQPGNIFYVAGSFVRDDNGQQKYVKAISLDYTIIQSIPLVNVSSLRSAESYLRTFRVLGETRMYGFGDPGAKRICHGHGDNLNVVNIDQTQKGIFICTLPKMMDFKRSPFNVEYVASASAWEDALGRPIYHAIGVTPLDQDGKAQK